MPLEAYAPYLDLVRWEQACPPLPHTHTPLPADSGMPLEAYAPYLDLRRYGSVPHSGMRHEWGVSGWRVYGTGSGRREGQR